MQALIWLRRDLRLADHPALGAALAEGLTPVPVYVHDPAQPCGGASAWWLHHSLERLQQSLRAAGSDLVVLHGDSAETLLTLAQRIGARAVYWNRRYEPATLELDAAVKRRLRDAGLHARSFAAALLREPWTFGKADGSPYRVFTAFWNALNKIGPARQAVDAPSTLPGPSAAPQPGGGVAALDLLPAIPWDKAFPNLWSPGEQGAHAALQRFLDAHLADYPTQRDHPCQAATSRLSPHLHFGEISPVQVWQTVQTWIDTHTEAGCVGAGESVLRQIAWREFAAHLLFHFPHTLEAPLDARYDAFPWRGDYAADLAAWQRGQTGIPLVDAGMRELWTHGWMHNRVRMVVASLLAKNLRIPWQAGAAWFMDTLVDADAANNSFGWQWSAGCGADAAPYYRVFNPVRQGERFDADGSYVRRWVPELARLPAKWIQQPWAAPSRVLSGAGLELERDYPAPIVDLAASRKAALQAWEAVRDAARAR